MKPRLSTKKTAPTKSNPTANALIANNVNPRITDYITPYRRDGAVYAPSITELY